VSVLTGAKALPNKQRGFADVFVLVEDGLPRRVVRTDCLQLRVTRDGVLDQLEKQRLLSLAVRSLRLPNPWAKTRGVVYADHTIARAAIRKFHWIPTAHPRATMQRLALSRRGRG
jgi:hypothetical protein